MPSGRVATHTHCTIGECAKPHLAKGMCGMHYRRNFLYGNPNIKLISGDKKRGKYKIVQANGHPNANAKGSIPEHRLIMSQHLGRPLRPGENVHHINGNPKDNRIENLELWLVAQPSGQRPDDLVKWATEILTNYAPHLLNKGI
jgi:hypothetical protein